MTSLGFVLLSHQNSEQIQRLVRQLNVMYGDPLIVCHHDNSQSTRPELPGNVKYVRSMATGWGDFSLVEALLACLRVYRSVVGAPEWVTFISGADFPVRASKSVLEELRNARSDVFMDTKLVHPVGRTEPWVDVRLKRYYGYRIWLGHVIPGVRRRHGTSSVGPRGDIATKFMSPFGDGMSCYAGSQWFTANQRAVDALLEGASELTKLRRRYRWVFCPDESYVHTILGNRQDIDIDPNGRRYIDWGTGHPKFLGVKDLPAIRTSGAWFARKFDGRDVDVLASLESEL